MFQNIKKNKAKTWIIVSIFLIVITLIVYYICHAFNLGPLAIIIAFAFSIITTWGTYYNSDKIVLKMNNARPATEEENKKLVNIFNSLMLSSGLTHKPALYIEDDPQPNAFATGRDPEHAVVCVTTGLLERMDYYELEGVIAHELAHIKNYDIRLSAIVSVMVGLIVMLSDMFSHFFLFSNDSDSDSGKGHTILMILGVIALILAPIFGSLMQLAISRKREFLADATAVEFTRNPDGLISALEKLEAYSEDLQNANKSTAHMYISSPFKANAKDGKKRKSSIWSTHPATEDRIEALKNLR